MAAATSDPEQNEVEKESATKDEGGASMPEPNEVVERSEGSAQVEEVNKEDLSATKESSPEPKHLDVQAVEGVTDGDEDDDAAELDLAVLREMAAEPSEPETMAGPSRTEVQAEPPTGKDACGAEGEEDEDFAVAVADAYGLIEEAGDDVDTNMDEPDEQYDAEAAAKWAEEDAALTTSVQDSVEEEGRKADAHAKGHKDGDAVKGSNGAAKGSPQEAGATSPLELDVQYYALGRKLDTAREKLTLNLSKEGAKSALMVAEGHVAYLPDVTQGKRVHFQVLSVKPWSAYLELQTCNGKEHGLAVEDVKNGGRVRVRVGASLVEEVALQAIRVPRLPKAGLALSSFMSQVQELGGSAMEQYCQSTRPPRWLENSSHFVCRYSDARSEHLIRPAKEVENRTPLESTLRVLLAPMTRKGVAQSFREEALSKVLLRLQAVLPASLPPLSDVGAFRRWVERSPGFEIQSKDIEGEKQEIVCIKASERDKLTPGPEPVKEVKANAAKTVEKPKKEVQRPVAEEPEGGRQRRCGRAMQALDAVRKMHADALRFSRNKGRVAQLCTDAAARGTQTYENIVAPFLQVIAGLPEAVQRLHDELTETAKAGSELSELGTWNITLEEHKKRAEEMKELLCRETSAAMEEVEENLLRARHRFRDLQQQVLDPGLAALGGVPKGNSPPRDRSPPSKGKSTKGKGKDKGRRERGGKGKEGDKGDKGDKGFGTDKGAGKSRGDSRDPSRSRTKGSWWNSGNWEYDDWEDRQHARGNRWSGRAAGSRSRSQGESRKAASTSRFRGNVPDRLEAFDIQIGKENLYEVKSSEGPWYPATILRERRSGRYEACLYGGGCAVHYPSVELSEIRRIDLTDRPRDRSFQSHSRERVIRYDSRTRSKGDWKDSGRERRAWG